MCELWPGWANIVRYLKIRLKDRSVAAVLLSKHLKEPTFDDNQDFFRSFELSLDGAPSMCSEQRCARKELYEAPGGNQVAAVPPRRSQRWPG
eukprot:8369603-Pyramimonas_sp.AAC.1